MISSTELPVEFSLPVFVRNTFLDVLERDPSFEEFYQERQTRSCPASPTKGFMDECWTCAGLGDAGSNCSTVDTAETDDAELLRTDSRCSTVSTVDSEQAGLSRADSQCSTIDTVEQQTVERPAVVAACAAAPWRRPKQQQAASFAEFPSLAPKVPSNGGSSPSSRPAGAWQTSSRSSTKDFSVDATAAAAPRRTVTWSSCLESVVDTAEAAGSSSSLEEAAVLPPSLGSREHGSGRCKPCAFFWTKGCESGVDCVFCHLCDSEEKKRRRKEKMQTMTKLRQMRKCVSNSWPTSLRHSE